MSPVSGKRRSSEQSHLRDGVHVRLDGWRVTLQLSHLGVTVAEIGQAHVRVQRDQHRANIPAHINTTCEDYDDIHTHER